ncbi:MAG: hypothetical protein ACK55I_14595, partial [bacterium]
MELPVVVASADPSKVAAYGQRPRRTARTARAPVENDRVAQHACAGERAAALHGGEHTGGDAAADD